MANSTTIEVGAEDNASPVLKRVGDAAEQQTQRINGALNSQGDASRRAAVKANDLEREWKKLTSGTEFLAEGVQGFRGALNSIVWGSAIGAAAALATQMIASAFATKDFNEELSKSSDRFTSLAGRLDPLLEKSEAYRHAQFNLMVAEFSVARAAAARAIVEADANLGRLESISIIDRLKFAMLSITDAALGEGLAQEHLKEATERNALAAEELKNRIAFMKIVMETSIPTWEEYQRVTSNQVKLLPDWAVGEERVNDSRQRQLFLVRELLGYEDALREARHLTTEEAINTPQEVAKAEEAIRQQRQATFQASMFLLGQLASLSSSSSRRMFEIAKAASIAQSLINTYQAATRALAEGGPFAGPALAAAITAAGLAQVAQIRATSFGGGGGAGGSGGLGGGGTPTTGNDLRSQDIGRPVQVSIQVNALDPASVDWDRLVQEQIAPAFGEHLQRGGSTGNVQITFERN